MRTCTIDGCEKPYLARGLCSMHYKRVRSTGTVGDAASMFMDRSGGCTVDGCELTVRARGLCGMHYERVRAFGDAGSAERMPAHRSRGGRILINGYVKVRMPEHPASTAGYVYEHRLVMEQHLGRRLARDEVVHHINENKTDNRLANLRVMTNSDHVRLHSTKAGTSCR